MLFTNLLKMTKSVRLKQKQNQTKLMICKILKQVKL